MDIKSALTSSGPPLHVGRCLLQRRLDSIPEDEAGKDELVDAIDSPDWSAPMLAKVLHRLDLPVSMTLIRQHRAGTCPCYLGGGKE